MAMVKSQGKTGFLKEFFVDHPDAGKTAIDEAWAEAGNEGTISDSLIHKVRAEQGLTGRGRRKSRGNAAKAGKRSTGAAKSGLRGSGLSTAGRASGRANGRDAATAGEPAVGRRATGGVRTRVLIELEGRIDDMIHEVKVVGGLSEFEDVLRKARRILVRNHGE